MFVPKFRYLHKRAHLYTYGQNHGNKIESNAAIRIGNPHFKMTDFLSGRIGEHEYKAPRMDGNQKIVIDESLIHEFGELEATQFDCCNPYYKDRVWGLFGEQDTLANFKALFLQHYNNSYHFPGGHTPTEQEVKT